MERIVDQSGVTVPTPPKVLVPLAGDVSDVSTVVAETAVADLCQIAVGKTIVRTPDGWLHAVASQQVGGVWTLVYINSRDGGLHWSAPLRIDDNAHNKFFPSIAYTIDYTATTDPVVLHVAYLDANDFPSPTTSGVIGYTRFRNGAWSASVTVSTDVLTYDTTIVTLSGVAIASIHSLGQVVVSWAGKLGAGAYYLKATASDDNGATWTGEKNVNSYANTLTVPYIWSSHVTSEFYVTFIRNNGVNYDVGFASYTYGDGNWSAPSWVTTGDIAQSSGETEIDGTLDMVYVSSGGTGVQFIKSTDDGGTWSMESPVKVGLVNMLCPQVSCFATTTGSYYAVSFKHDIGLFDTPVSIVTGKPGAWNASTDLTGGGTWKTAPSLVNIYATPPSSTSEYRYAVYYNAGDWAMAFQCSSWGWGATPKYSNTGSGNSPYLQYTGDTVKFELVLWPDDSGAPNGFGLFVTIDASTAHPATRLYYTTSFYNDGDSKPYCDGVDEYFNINIVEGIQKVQLTSVGTEMNGQPSAGSLLTGGIMLVTNDLDRPLKIVSVTLEPIP